MSDGVGSRVSANRRRAVNLFRPVTAAEAVPTWRCPNEHCRAWVQPSKSQHPDLCHVCDAKRLA